MRFGGSVRIASLVDALRVIQLTRVLQYTKGAQDFVSNPPANVLTKTRANGDTILYDPSTNTFAVKTAQGSPRTMFKPTDGINYWNKQK